MFREKISGWQEAYMDKLNKEYIEWLSGKGSLSEKFWALEERIRNDMVVLDEFSDELKETIRFTIRYK